MNLVMRCRHALALLNTLAFIAIYRFLRAMKWKIYRLRMRKTARGRAVRKLCETAIRNAFWKLPSTSKYTSVSFPRRGYTVVENAKVYWEAPLGITIWDEKGPVCVVGLEFWHDTICIRQLQGVPGAKIPDAFQAWPRVFIAACQEAVRTAGMRRLRLYRAHTSLFYRFPDVSAVPPAHQEQARLDIRARMLRRYDYTAKRMGFVMMPLWGEWENPAWVRKAD